MSRRWLAPEEAADIGRLDPEAVTRVRAEAWPDAGNSDELHDALVLLGLLTADEVAAQPAWADWLAGLAHERRAARLSLPAGPLWVAAERLPHVRALWPHASLDPGIAAPTSSPADETTAETALVELLRGRLEGLGPVAEAALAAPLGRGPHDVAAALAALQAEGFAMRGRFTPGAMEDEWCERRLLARIHHYTVKRLRAEIEPVAARDFLRFLLTWQKAASESRMDGPDALEVVIAQLEGFEAPAGAWETEILPARLANYDPAWLDDLCLAGRVVWARLKPRNVRLNGERSASPVRTTPITLLPRRDAPVWASLSPAPETGPTSRGAEAVLGFLRAHGASFFDEVAEGSGLLRPQIEEALAELVALGLVNSDSFAGLRALLVPAEKRKSSSRRRAVRFDMQDAGRWTLARRPRGASEHQGEAIEHVARSLLRRYGVVFWRLLEREADWLPPWRDLLRVYRRLEARGEIRGGRFVAGFSGEQYAVPEAVGLLREIRRKPDGGALLSLSGADPLNLAGILTPGPKLAALTGNRLLYRDGIPLALLAGGDVKFLEAVDAGGEWAVRKALLRGAIPKALVGLT
jgi:ATP-dependent helicase Lhr and Lhr-like helicase